MYPITSFYSIKKIDWEILFTTLLQICKFFVSKSNFYRINSQKVIVSTFENPISGAERVNRY